MKSTDFPFPVRAEDGNRGSAQIDPGQDSVSSPCQGEDEGEGPITAQRIKIPFSVSSPCQGEDEGEGPITAQRVKIPLSVSSPCQGEDEGEGPITAQRVKIPFCLPSPATPRRPYGLVFSTGSS